MGSSLNKDQNVQVYMTLSKRMFYAGQNVQGIVHINCLKQRPYRYLNIVIDGREECFWTETNASTTIPYSNSRNTYHAQVSLARFDLGIQRGQYNFPFSILLPRAIPASVRVDPMNFIKYEISANIPAYDERSTAQIFKRSLHIRQPPRSIPQIIRTQSVQTSECCGCCCTCGSVALSLEADVSHINSDKIFHVRGAINNLNGQVSIKNFKIVLREIVKKISGFEFTDIDYQDFVLYDANKPVPKGTQENFQCQLKIPPEFIGYTAIGNIIYRTYYLSIVAEASCCISNPTLVAHTIVVNSSVPALQADQQKQPPVGWNPVTAQPLAFVNITPYIYNPSPAEPEVRNQAGNVVSGMMEQMPPGTSVAFNAVR